MRNTQTRTAIAPATSRTCRVIATAPVRPSRPPRTRGQRRRTAELPGTERGHGDERQEHPPQDPAPVGVDGELGQRLQLALGLELQTGPDRDHPRAGGDHRGRHQRPAQPPAPPRHDGVQDAGDGRQRREHDDDVDDERVEGQAVELHGIGIRRRSRRRFGIACAHVARHVGLHRRPPPRPRARRRRGLDHHDALQGPRPARDEQARPDAGHRRRPGRRGVDPPHPVAGALARRGARARSRAAPVTASGAG